MTLVVFGDSHSVVWGGRLILDDDELPLFANVQVNYLGPALAYNLMDDNGGLGKWGQQIIDHPSLIANETSAVMLSFGEIDCRTQVIKRAIRGGISIRDVCLTLVNRYLTFIDIISARINTPIIIWGPIASGSHSNLWDPHFPNIGSEIERNTATREFNSLLALGVLERSNIHHIDILKDMISPLGETYTELQHDGCHLNAKGLGLAISVFNNLMSEIRPEAHQYFEISPLFRSQRAVVTDVSRYARISEVSSDIGNFTRSLLSAKGNTDIFHTKKELKPNILIDLGHGIFLDRIEVTTSKRDTLKAFRSLKVYVSQDKSQFDLIYNQNGADLSDSAVSFSFYNSESYRPVRFLRMELTDNNEFVLKGIKLYGKTFSN